MLATGSRIVVFAVLSLAMAGCQIKDPVHAADPMSADAAQRFAGFGNYARTVTTESEEAQAWFNQGMQLLYGFNHDEAIRTFRKAAEIDPQCAMAWWGVSYAHGLHINNPVMTEEQSRGGYDAAIQAKRVAQFASPVEQALIRAVNTRYAWPPPADRKPLDEAYAVAMGEAWRQFPDDPDVGVLYAESMMNLQPWNYWTHDGQPKGRALEIVAVLEKVIATTPRHPGANHFYIHAVEASPDPGKAIAAADRLRNLVPGSGHLTHMPSHIDIRTGRYAAAADTNARAIKVDEAYFGKAPPPRFYNVYYAHNMHFLAYASMMEGRYDEAIGASRRLERRIPPDFLREYVKVADAFMPTVLHVMIRFGKWEKILNEPAPPEWRMLSRAERHYARTIALAALKRLDEARSELDQFDSVVATMGDDWFVGNNPAKVILGLARGMASGELAYHSGEHDKAFAILRETVAKEDLLVYDEPPGWMQPVRHALGALLLADGKAAEAEEVYRADLKKNPNNGWSLLGLEQALKAQNKMDEVPAIVAQRKNVWRRADVKPMSSCYCAPGKS